MEIELAEWHKVKAIIKATRGYVVANSRCRCIHCHEMRKALEAWDGKPLKLPDSEWNHTKLAEKENGAK